MPSVAPCHPTYQTVTTYRPSCIVVADRLSNPVPVYDSITLGVREP